MIRYTSQNQLSFENFQTPFERTLDPNNRWVKLAGLIPWDEIAQIYFRSLSPGKGRPSIDARVVIGSIIVKHRLKLSDRETIEMIQENIYLQYFLGYASFNPDPPFDASLFVTLRKRMGADKFDEMSCRIIEKAKGIKKPKPDEKKDPPEEELSSQEDAAESQTKHKGKLKLDATVADQMIEYPTDLKLLNQARLESERIIDILYKQSNRWIKPRTYRRNARNQYLAIAKKRGKSRQVIRRGLRQQLGYVRRNFKTIEKLLDELQARPFPLVFRDLKIYWVIQHVYAQQKFMYDHKVKRHPDRIVNIYQPYVRPIPRGKDKGKTEFGAKLGVSEFDGFCRLDHISWDAYNECGDLIEQVKAYKTLHGYFPEVVLVDRIYLTRANRKWLKSKGIRHIGQPLGRPKPLSAYFKRKLRKERNMRNHVEGKFGQGKNAYELSRIRARRQDTSESWISAIFLVMNLMRWLKIQPAIIWLIISQILWWLVIFSPKKAQPLRPNGQRGWYLELIPVHKQLNVLH